MSKHLKGNAVVGQSGGPTAVINQSLVGLLLELRKVGQVGSVLGARHGVRGIIEEKFIPLDDAPDDLLERIAGTPSAALGSTRDKPDHAYCEKILRAFQKHNVRYFYYIGGNDSADTARIVHDLAGKDGYELNVFHIPKTIDNDLRVHDHCPGYGSAAKFVASAIMGDNFDNKSLPGIKVDVIMGRNAGFLTASAVLARQHDDDGPHLIYVPELPLSAEKILADVDRVYSKHKRCVIAISEGIITPEKKTWLEHLNPHLDRDMHGNVQLSGIGALGDFMAEFLRNNLPSPGGKKLRVRADTFGYLQRSFPGYVSEVDAKEARLVGQMAARYSAEHSSGSVAMRRKPGKHYEIETFLTPLDTVAKVTKCLDSSYIVNGNDIAPSFRDYVLPLVGELPTVGSFDELAR